MAEKRTLDSKDTAEPPLEKKPRTARAKKKGWKEGQKFDTPENDDSSKAFYESLLKENPDSVMSMKWLVEHGLILEVDVRYTCKLIEMRLKANEKDKKKPKRARSRGPQAKRF